MPQSWLPMPMICYWAGELGEGERNQKEEHDTKKQKSVAPGSAAEGTPVPGTTGAPPGAKDDQPVRDCRAPLQDVPLQQPGDWLPPKEVLAQRVPRSLGATAEAPASPCTAKLRGAQTAPAARQWQFPALGQSPHPTCPALAVGPAASELQVQIHLSANGSVRMDRENLAARMPQQCRHRGKGSRARGWVSSPAAG